MAVDVLIRPNKAGTGLDSEAINHIIFLIRNESFAIHLESACLEQSRKHLPMSIPEVAFVLFDPSLHLFPTEKRENSKKKERNRSFSLNFCH